MILFTANFQTEEIRKLSDLLKSLGLTNCFNPSFIQLDDRLFMSFRTYDQSQKKIRSFMITHYRKSEETHLQALDDLFSFKKVADPKFFLLGSEVWLTFNTGHESTGNQLYIARIHPDVQNPIECRYKGRQLIEKNWAFFSEGPQLKCVYSIDPLVVLEASTTPFQNATELDFNLSFKSDRRYKGQYSLGTQLCRVEGLYRMIVHRKLKIFGKRMYLGVPATFRNKAPDDYQITLHRPYLCHTILSLFGSIKRHNPNLISCTYFSGIDLSRNANASILLSYGINDRSYGFSSISEELLWR